MTTVISWYSGWIPGFMTLLLLPLPIPTGDEPRHIAPQGRNCQRHSPLFLPPAREREGRLVVPSGSGGLWRHALFGKFPSRLLGLVQRQAHAAQHVRCLGELD